MNNVIKMSDFRVKKTLENKEYENKVKLLSIKEFQDEFIRHSKYMQTTPFDEVSIEEAVKGKILLDRFERLLPPGLHADIISVARSLIDNVIEKYKKEM